MDALLVILIVTAALGLILYLVLAPHKPVEMLSHPGDIVFGTALPPAPRPLFTLGPKEQAYHAAIFGRSGSGKSRLLQSIFQQILYINKHSAGIIEPHHDLSFDTICFLVKDGYFRHMKDAFSNLVYIDWGNGSYVPFNILAGPGNPKTKARNALEAMLRVWPELHDAPIFQTLFLAGVTTLIANKLPITFLYQLLTDSDFRARCLTRVSDPLLDQTFASYDKLGRDQVQVAGSLLRRCFLLCYSDLTRLTLGQPDNILDFRAMMDQGKSFIINLGNIGDDETRKLIGALLLVQIEQAALSRTDILPSQRKPLTLLIDEWPSFAATEKTISTILSQTRKFNLRLYLAAQSLAQVDSQRLVGALENCKLQVVFGLGGSSADIEAREIGKIDPFAVKEDPATQTQLGQHFAINEQLWMWRDQLTRLEPRYAYVKLEGQDAVKIMTGNLPNTEPDPDELAEVLATYRTRYQRSQVEAEAAIATLAEPHDARAASKGEANASPIYTQLFQPQNSQDDDVN
jgi:hypothetical protein